MKNLGLQLQLLQALAKLDIVTATEIQQKAIPILLQNQNDFVGLSKTGSGKTIAFSLPLLQLIDVNNTAVQAIVISPTRELAQQIFSSIKQINNLVTNIKIGLCTGGTTLKSSVEQVNQKPQIVVATPGRLLDLIEQNQINLEFCQFLVLDEADELVVAHQEVLNKILLKTSKTSRKWLFSATMSGAVKQLIQNYLLKNAQTISVDIDDLETLNIDHQYIAVDAIEKLDVLMHFLTSKDGEQGIVFCKTKAAVNKLAKNLAINKFSSGAIHSSLTQSIRDRVMQQFRSGTIKILIATDLAARGLDIPKVSYVVHYHLPDASDIYVHRSGRTARGEGSGFSLSIIQNDEMVALKEMQAKLGLSFKEFKKPNAQNLENNNAYLWAKQLYKAKPKHDLDEDVKLKIKTIFGQLSKDELLDKMIGYYYFSQK